MVAPNGRLRAYRKSAIEANRKELSEAEAGDRNNTLNKCAFALGQLEPAGIIGEAEARAVLSEAASACGLGAT